MLARRATKTFLSALLTVVLSPWMGAEAAQSSSTVPKVRLIATGGTISNPKDGAEIQRMFTEY